MLKRRARAVIALGMVILLAMAVMWSKSRESVRGGDAGVTDVAVADRIDAELRARREERLLPPLADQLPAERALAIRVASGRDSIESVTSVLNLAWFEARRGDATRALALAERARVLTTESTERTADTAFAHEILGWVAKQSGDLRRAEAEYEESLRLRELVFGPQHLEVAASLNLLGGVQKDLRKLTQAERSLARALAIREQQLPPRHRLIGASWSVLADLRLEQGEYEQAKSFYEKALPVREAANDSLGIAETSYNLGILCTTLGEYQRARDLSTRALEIRRSIYGAEHPAIASAIRRLARLEQFAGNYTTAIALYEQALAILTGSADARQAQAAHCMVDLARLLAELQQDERALALFERAIDVTRAVYGPEHPRVANGLGWLATFWVERDSLHRAAVLFEESRRILARADGVTTLERAWAEIDLAATWGKLGRRDESRAMFAAALPAIGHAQGSQHTEMARALGIHAEFLIDGGEWSEARRALQRAADIVTATLGPDDRIVGDYRASIARVLAASGHSSEGFATALQAEQIGRDHLRWTARSLSESYALGYARKRGRGREIVLQLAARDVDQIPNAAARAYDVLVRWRGLVLDEMAGRSRAIAATGDSTTRRLVLELNSARERLANLIVRGPEGIPPDRYRELLAAAQEVRERAEQRLARRSASFRRELELSQVGLAEIAAALPPHSALVSWVRFDAAEHFSSEPSRAEYLAFVLRAGEKTPDMVSLGSAAAIDSCVQRWRATILFESDLLRDREADCRNAGEVLRRLAWDPLEAAFAGAERLFLVADGALQMVSFAGLPAAGGGYLVEGSRLLHSLSVERDVVAAALRSDVGDGLLAIGGPDFDADGIESRGTGADIALRRGVHATDGTRSKFPCADLASTLFPPLPAARAEIKSIAGIWRRSRHRSRSEVIEKTGKRASEVAFKRYAPGRRIVHVATHGFFLGAECGAANRQSRGIAVTGPPRSDRIPIENPLLRAGLVFAGANGRGRTAPGREDGILTAEELAGLDLHQVEWAVLSACDTGVGDVVQSEGVFGMRRALELAGVHTSIMSLWPVADATTEEWMRYLYDSRLHQGLDTPHAVRQAMLEMLRRVRTDQAHAHPAAWAGFVAAGDWR
jgi:CHAT domain-containing protein/Tfp pilus assembly protein PilF